MASESLFPSEPAKPVNALLLSAYDAMSHEYWRIGLVEYMKDIKWTVMTLPPRFFSWRIRGNPLSWYEAPELERNYDLIIATSMVDVATLKGLVPHLAAVPTIIYFHENQFVYPVTAAQVPSIEPQMVSIYSSISARVLLFNSHYNRDSFFAGIKALFAKLPDGVPRGLLQKLRQKAQVLSVPLADHIPFRSASHATDYTVKQNTPLNVVWNHRWEYDKGVERLFHAVNLLPPNTPICFHILGQRFRQIPRIVSQLHTLLEQNGWLGHWGFITDREEYQHALCRSQVALSTSLHDFQGLATMQAVAAGCVPLVPDRLAYREFYGPEYRYPSYVKEPTREAQALAALLTAWANSAQRLPPAPQLHAWSWSELGPRYRQCFYSAVENEAGQ